MKRRILFLFNHDAAHQAAHIAGIAGQLALDADDVQVVVATGVETIRRVVLSIIPVEAHARIEWRSLDIPGDAARWLGPLNNVAPVLRLARLRYNMSLFRDVEIVVSTERTCLRVRRELGEGGPRFVYVPHGSGDRNVAYHPELAQFDAMLLSGRKLVDEMVRHGLATPKKCHVIGYPKFDAVAARPRRRLFDNDRPVFLYNPHFDPHLSSWYSMGERVMDYFHRNPRYNLIVAPHVMLFRKKLHYSLEYRTAKRRPDLPDHFRDAPNILVDLDSRSLFDMSYTMAADAYIGDVSSQVYEFLLRRGACFFLDAAGQTRDGHPPPYEFWGNGAVCRTVEALERLIPSWAEQAARFRPAQDRLFAYTIDHDDECSSIRRGAQALHAMQAAPVRDRPRRERIGQRQPELALT